MAGEPIVARTAWSKDGTTYVTIRWNGAVRTRVASPDARGGWTITLPGIGDTAVILPATIGVEPTEGRLARSATMGARLAAGENGARAGRRSSQWEDLPPTSASPQAPRDRTVFSQALKTIRARADGATLDEIKESFREIDLYHHDPLTLLRWQHDNRGWGFRMNPATRRITLWTFDGVPDEHDEFDEPHNVSFEPVTVATRASRTAQDHVARDEFDEPHNMNASPTTVAFRTSRTGAQSPHAAAIERGRSEAHAESQRAEEERRRMLREHHANDLERERQEIAEQYRQLEQERQRVREIERQNVEARSEWQRIQAEREQLELARRQLEADRAALLSPADTGLSTPVACELDIAAWLLEIPDPDRSVFRHLADHGSINEVEATQMLGGARQFRRFSVKIEEQLARVPFKVRIEMSGDMKCYVRERGSE